MQRLTNIAHEILRSRINPGDIAVDATAGNGLDTLFLARCVGPKGLVYSFDLQLEAVRQTEDRLAAAGVSNVRLLLRDHAELAEAIAPEHLGRIAAVMFNLGYLPGSDKTFRTQPETTGRAIEAGLSLLREGGVLSVLAYTGHPGGLEEADAVARLLGGLPEHEFAVKETSSPRPNAPRLFVVIRLGLDST